MEKKYNKDLNYILNEAKKITLDDLEFDNMFNQQSKILCDIKLFNEGLKMYSVINNRQVKQLETPTPISSSTSIHTPYKSEPGS